MNVSSSLLYVWLTTLCVRMSHTMDAVAQMKMIFITELYLPRRAERAREGSTAAHRTPGPCTRRAHSEMKDVNRSR